MALKSQVELDGSEFSGGSVTRPLLTMNLIGMVLMVAAAFFIFFRSRGSTIVAVAASILCLPLYMYNTTPYLFRRALPGTYSVPLQAFGWEGWSIAGILLSLLIPYLCYRRRLS